MNLGTSGVVVGSLMAVAGLSVLRARAMASRSFAEIEFLPMPEPMATYVGPRTVRPMGGPSSELLAADGSRVRVGRGLSLMNGTLSTETFRTAPRVGSDVFLL